jgi:hypothetical protein
VIENGRVIDAIDNADLAANVARLHDYLGVGTRSNRRQRSGSWP